MSKLYALLLAVLFLLTACAYESPVFVTATPVGSEVPTIVNNMTIEPDVTATQAIVTNTPSLTVTKGVPQSVCNRISYNINGFAVADWTYLKQHLVNIRPCSVLMMGDSGRALELMDLLPDTLVVFRAYHEDDIRIVAPDDTNPVEFLERNYGIPEYMNDIRGAPSHCRLYVEFYYPDQSCAESIMMMWQWWDTVADETYHSVDVFTWSQNDDWMTFNVDGTETVFNGFELHRLLEAYARGLFGKLIIQFSYG
ncbi:MAG: hypothetical protein Q9P01_05710 [Anaerolineae bacterium]|nr:hypothetical protein [Anaerolineae bacterium]